MNFCLRIDSCWIIRPLNDHRIYEFDDLNDSIDCLQEINLAPGSGGS